MEELIGIYKGLRLPLLGLIVLIMTIWVFRPSRKREIEQAKYDMLDDDLDPELGARFAPVKDAETQGVKNGG